MLILWQSRQYESRMQALNVSKEDSLQVIPISFLSEITDSYAVHIKIIIVLL